MSFCSAWRGPSIPCPRRRSDGWHAGRSYVRLRATTHTAVTACGDATNIRKGMGLGEVRFRGLLLGGLADDSSAYHTFLKELSGHLRAFLRKRLVNLPEEVEDLAQELLLAVHDQRHTYDPGQPITAWIYTIARHKLIDLLRQRSHKECSTICWTKRTIFSPLRTARRPRLAAIWPSCWRIFPT